MRLIPIPEKMRMDKYIEKGIQDRSYRSLHSYFSLGYKQIS